MVLQNLQAAHAVVSRANVVKIFTSDIIISLLFQTFLLIFLKLQRTHVYIDYKRKPLIGRAKRASCSSLLDTWHLEDSEPETVILVVILCTKSVGLNGNSYITILLLFF